MKNKIFKNVFIFLLGLLFILGIFLFLSFFNRNIGYVKFKVSGFNMEPNIKRGSLVYVDKLAYEKDQPQRGDIVAYKAPFSKKKIFISRIAGLEEEEINIENGRLIIDKQLIEHPDIFKKNIYKLAEEDHDCVSLPMEIPKGSIFVLGDNSLQSYDSRYWGAVYIDNIIGKVSKIKGKSNIVYESESKRNASKEKEAFLDKNTKIAENYLKLAEDLISEGRYDEALKNYDLIKSLDIIISVQITAWDKKAELFKKLKKWDKVKNEILGCILWLDSIEDFENKNNLKGTRYIRLGDICLENLNDSFQAIRFYKEAKKLLTISSLRLIVEEKIKGEIKETAVNAQ